MKSPFLQVMLAISLLFFLPKAKSQDLVDRDAALASARAGLDYLRNVMERYHKSFGVYEDVSSPGNHFHAYAKIPDGGAPVEMNGSYPLPSPSGQHQTGATVIRCRFFPIGGYDYAGYYFQNGALFTGQLTPSPNFGTVPNAGVNLGGAVRLSFWAKGEQGGEKIEFFMGGVGRDAVTGMPYANTPYPDSALRTPAVGTLTALTTSWQKFSILLNGVNLQYVLGGFGWVAGRSLNPSGATFYLEDVQYELSDAAANARLLQPRFLRSFTTLPLQPNVNDAVKADDIDLVLRNCAFVYDNALALLAFLADFSAANLERAKRIGDAFVYAANHDRYFTDGRLRDAYAAGDVALPPGWTANNRTGTVPVAGYYDEAVQRFVEIESGISVGNNAWAMIALLQLFEATGDSAYFNTAKRIGLFIRDFRNDTGLYKGFRGGLDSAEAAPKRRQWASTEHNLDVYAAFGEMYKLTGEAQWQNDALHAKAFVDAMWSPALTAYFTGTLHPNQRNEAAGQLPLDPQTWSVLALPAEIQTHPQILAAAEGHQQTVHHGFTGFDFNEDRDGVWFEGTAQMSVANGFAATPQKAYNLRKELRRVQNTAPYGDSLGVSAACHDSVSTGFDFSLFRRLHVGATSWHVFAQLQVNPYYGNRIVGLCAGGSASFTTNLSGGSYQWQVDAGSGYVNLSNGGYYAGVKTATLQLSNAPPAWYGYKFRCLTDGAAGNEFLLRFSTAWTGVVSTAWENPGNWTCGLPDAYTDTYIETGAVVLGTAGFCRHLLLGNNATLTVKPGYALAITH